MNLITICWPAVMRTLTVITGTMTIVAWVFVSTELVMKEEKWKRIIGILMFVVLSVAVLILIYIVIADSMCG